jgi:hypothetical protein
VLLALPIDEKRAFLQFCTGCDRAAVAGLGALRLSVQVRQMYHIKAVFTHTDAVDLDL